METVTLYHPALKREHAFPASSVEQWKRAGWRTKKAPVRQERREEENEAAAERRNAEESQ